LAPLTETELESLGDDDPHEILAQEVGYLQRNRERIDYPRYRQQGLRWMSGHVESTAKLESAEWENRRDILTSDRRSANRVLHPTAALTRATIARGTRFR
jgi:hypothetical protein